jgi:hypothetical protein
MVDFSKLKASSGKLSLEKISQEIAKMNAPTEGGQDNRFWYPNVDKVGNGYAVIRFLPAPGDEPVPFVRVWEHGFKGPTGQWYIEKSLTTIGKPDPVSEINSKLWNMSEDDNSPTRKQARDQKRKLVYISNIYVIEDKANPENNGKVFLFKFGKKIFDKINEAMNPQFADEDALNPFDLWDGANFKLKIRNVEGYRNYDKSEFASPSPLFNDDEELEAVWKQEHSLQAFLSESNFKSYEELKKRLELVLDVKNTTKQNVTSSNSTVDDVLDDEIPALATPAVRATKTKPAPSKTTDVDEDEDMEFFRNLASRDD